MQNTIRLISLNGLNGVSRIVFLESFKAFSREGQRMREHKGQSTVEYILLVTAVIAVVILFTAGPNNLFQSRLNSVFNSTTQDMVNVASRLQDNAAPGG